jgi:PAS domain S-box-containing protein
MKSNLNRWLIVAVVIILVAGTAVSLWTARQEDQHMRDQLLTQGRLAGEGINLLQVASLTGSGADLASPDYVALKKQMTAFRAADPDIRFAYLIGRQADGAYFFFVDSEPPESNDYSPPGQEYPEVTVLTKKVFTTGIPLTEGPDSDRWGTWVSSIVPVRDPDTGRTLAVFGMDVDARNWSSKIFVACLPPLAGTLLILVLVLTFFSIQRYNERERQQLESSAKLIRESEERYRLLFTRSPVGIVQLDKNGVIVTVNQKFSDIMGASPEQLIGFDTVARIRNPAMVAAIRDSLGGKNGFFEGEYLSVAGGKKSIIRMVSQPISIGDTGVNGAIGIFEDITERKAAEQALFESERRYRSVVEDQTELICRFRPDGTHVFVNDAYCRFFLLDRSIITGNKFFPKIPSEDRVLVKKHLLSLTQEAPVAEITHRIILPDGQVRWLRWFDRAIFSNQGELVEYQSVGRDITWQKLIEGRLSLTNQKLNLLSSITRHDVLNQLLVLNGYLQLCTESVHDHPEKIHEYLERAKKAVTTIDAQINFTRIYKDVGSLAPSWQDLNTCIIMAKGGLPPVDIRTKLHRPGLEVFADLLLEKVFYNLFDNAIRYGGEQMKMIQVTSQETPDGLVLVCEDNGAGIAEDDKGRLFTQGFGKNTGFGLFLSREILSISGIAIKETSMPGRGARFEITVPKGGYRFTGSGEKTDKK